MLRCTYVRVSTRFSGVAVAKVRAKVSRLKFPLFHDLFLTTISPPSHENESSVAIKQSLEETGDTACYLKDGIVASL